LYYEVYLKSHFTDFDDYFIFSGLEMKKNILIFMEYFITTGGLFALLMVLFDYFQGDSFHWNKFIFHFVSFGLFMGLYCYYQIKSKKNSENKN